MPQTASRARTLFALLDDAGPTVSVPVAGRCLGINRATAYELAARNELGVPVLRLGRSLRVPTAELRRVLGLGELGGDRHDRRRRAAAGEDPFIEAPRRNADLPVRPAERGRAGTRSDVLGSGEQPRGGGAA
jgi:hypothetical protein